MEAHDFARRLTDADELIRDPAEAPGGEADRVVAFGRYAIKSGGASPRPWKGKSSLLLASSPFGTLPKPMC